MNLSHPISREESNKLDRSDTPTLEVAINIDVIITSCPTVTGRFNKLELFANDLNLFKESIKETSKE